jgi:hypothetical protein
MRNRRLAGLLGGAICAVVVLAAASGAWAYGYYDLGLGTAVFQGSPRGAGMGEVSLLTEDSPLAATINPALLGGFASPGLILSYRAASVDETWAFPIHDSFDAFLGYSDYSYNADIYSDFAGGLASGRLGMAQDFSFAVALVPAYDFRYDYSEEIRDRNSSAQPPDRIIANNFIEGTGVIRSLSFAVGRPIAGGLALGAGLDYLFGDRSLDARIEFVDPNKIPWESSSPETSDTFEANDLTGTRLVLGAAYELSRRISVAATYRSETDLDGDISYEVGGPADVIGNPEALIKFPSSYALGVSFRPRNEMPTVIEGDVILTRWSQVPDPTGIGPEASDTYEWHIGVEHVFYNERPVRFGFFYRPSPRDKETGEAAVTAGTGFDLGGVGIDLAGRIGWREFRSPDLFSDDIYGAQLREGTDQVRETLLGATVSVSKRF